MTDNIIMEGIKMAVYQNNLGLYYIKGKYKDEYGNFKDYMRFTGKKGFKGKKEAIKADNNFREKKELLLSKDIHRTDYTFQDITNMYFSHVENTLKQSTIDTDKQVLENFQDWKEVKIYKFSSDYINMRLHAIDRDKKLSLAYISKCYYTINKIFKFAYKKKIISVNPMDDVDKIKRPNEVKEQNENFWHENDFEEFIQYVDDPLYFTIFTFLYCTGCRRGEVLALQWNDIDFTKKSFRINKTCYQVNGSYLLTPPKTKNSLRIRGMGKGLIKVMKEWYNIQKKIYGFNEKYFVFGADKPIADSTLQRQFANSQKIGNGWCKGKIITGKLEVGSRVEVNGMIYRDSIEKNGKKFKGSVIIRSIVKNKNGLNYYVEMPFKVISIHGFRHSHVSMLTNGGATIQDVAYRIGDTIEQVQRTYSHFFPPREQEMLDIIDKVKITRRT